MQLKNNKVLVVGAGKSGLAAARALANKGAQVTLCDTKPREAMNVPEDFAERGIEIYGGGYPELLEHAFQEVVMSPGVPLTVAPAQSALEEGIKITGELELAFQISKAPFIAITGTNGKTTTTSLMGAILEEAGWDPLVGGNIGSPLVEEVESLSAHQWVVAEVSSFQLETVQRFHPKVAMILNITPDHLDRHGTMEEYSAIKRRIYAKQGADDITVLNGDDPLLKPFISSCPGQVYTFSTKGIVERGAFFDGEQICFVSSAGTLSLLKVKDMQIRGLHNIENAMAASTAALALGIAPATVIEALKKFRPVEHRMEPAGVVADVTYVNDSKGTNPDAAIKAIESYEQPIVLIAGGKNKGSDFSQLAEVISKKVKAVILVGEATSAIKKALLAQGYNDDAIVEVQDFAKTVQKSAEFAEPGDVVLLSPACASWDMFPSYEVRGRLFKSLVQELKAEKNL
ncbi:UDP-N-acetylmuramoyl-L-alanine--D-glutamate ligase [Heliorestis acidaminivorans]|uniref:UDP-N-acetylmuramoylalanine--D-glutamate ligase n=1 Tax=Heliorestis acidaminivorans TaxID=553427 RepID=A0A6I0F5C2_9FIRM|nr:UDP-N-acetylmuramoyl-L-alanine--D-glutamate ligase [Heliorestis acidaminivorans]